MKAAFTGTDRFAVMRSLGAGGMGVVYEVLDRERGVKVALKTLHSLDADGLFRLKSEFHSLQDLHHPNLVLLGELICDGPQWFFTMELLEGGDLLSYVRPGLQPLATDVTETNPTGGKPLAPRPRSGHFDPERVRDGFAQLARGVGALHAAGIVHRDIKPSNVLVSRGRVVLVDFGLAMDLRDPLASFHAVGTPAYMAPEQAAEHAVGPEADWYAVGVMLYEALTGDVPFASEARDYMAQKQKGEPPPPGTLCEVPRDLDELCRGLLRLDPAARPRGPDVLRRLERRLARPAPAPQIDAFSSLQPPPFIGRSEELRVLAAAFERSRTVAVTAWIDGESGVGKSALVRRFVEALAAERRDLVVLTGRCYERDSVPYKAFDGVVDALSRYMRGLSEADAAALLPRKAALLPQVFPVLGRVQAFARAPSLPGALDPLELRGRAFAALRELLALLAERHPLVIVVDDVHWADADSAALLEELLRPPDAPPLLFVATARVGADAWERLMAHLPGEVERVHLERLSPGAATELAARLLRSDGAVDATAEGIAREADGHPLFIDELVRHLKLQRAPAPVLRLDDALRARIERLEPRARRVLETVAVAGRPLGLEVAAQASGCDAGALGDELSRLRSAQMVRTTGLRRADTVEPYHDRVRAAVLVHLAPETRRAAHEQLALALHGSPHAVDPEALAYHWLEAGHEDKAAKWVVLAAEQAAAALAFDRAARLYRLALSLPGADRALKTRLGLALTNAGRGLDAAGAFLDAADGAPTDEALELRRRAATQLLFSGHVDRGIAVLDTVLAGVGMRQPGSTRSTVAALLLRRAQLRMRGLDYREVAERDVSRAMLARIDVCQGVAVSLGIHDHFRAAWFNVRGLLMALDAGDPLRVARGLAAEVVFGAVAGRRGMEPLIARAEALAQRVEDPRCLATVWGGAGMACYQQGRWREAGELLEKSDTQFRDRCGDAWGERTTVNLFMLRSFLQLGRLAELCRRVPVCLRDAEERGDLTYAASLRSGLVNQTWLIADDLDGARAQLAESVRQTSLHPNPIQRFWAEIAGGQQDLYAEDGGAAHGRLEAYWPELERSQLLRLPLANIDGRCLRARAALAACSSPSADREAMTAIAAREARVVARVHWAPQAAPLAALIEAGVASVRRDRDGARAHVSRAVDGFERAGMALHVAAARRSLGRLTGDTAQVATVDAWLMLEGVRNPSRLVQMLAPGF